MWKKPKDTEHRPFASLADKVEALGKAVVQEDSKKVEKLIHLMRIKHELDKKNHSIPDS